MKIVKIEWLDICHGTPNWSHLDSLEVGPLECVSVGFLIKETDEYICIAENYNESENIVADTMTFPKAIVSKVEELKPLNELV